MKTKRCMEMKKYFVVPSQCDYARTIYGNENKVIIKFMDNSLTKEQHRLGKGLMCECSLSWEKDCIQLEIQNEWESVSGDPEANSLILGGIKEIVSYFYLMRGSEISQKLSEEENIAAFCKGLEENGYENLAFKKGDIENLIKASGWRKTDDLQYIKHINDTTFFLVEVRNIVEYDGIVYGVVADVINIDTYSEEDIADVMSSYYASMKEFDEVMAACTLREKNGIIAECLFESCSDLTSDENYIFTDEEEAEYYLDRYILHYEMGYVLNYEMRKDDEK